MSKTRYTQADDIFRELLKETRMAKNLTQAEVARSLGLPQSYVSKYESGERRLDLIELEEICKAMGISLIDFVKKFERL